MRIRTIKPQFWKHRMHRSITEHSALVAIALINYADDYGKFEADEELFKAECFPLRPKIDITKAWEQLASVGFVRFYKSLQMPDVARLGIVMSFRDHQKINRPTKSVFPDPEGTLIEDSVNTHELLIEDSLLERKGKEGNGKEEERKGMELSSFDSAPKRFCKPSVSDVNAYACEAKLTMDAQKFHDYYESKGWKVGNTPMKDWKAAARNWARNQYGNDKPAANKLAGINPKALSAF